MQPYDSIHCIQLDQSKRQDAIQSVWGQSAIPATLPGPVTTVASPLSSDSANLNHAERWEHGTTSPRVFHPVSANGKAVVVHQGHGIHISDLGFRDLINALVDSGFLVVALVMPGDDETTSGGTATHGGLPLSDFLTPVAVAVNRLESLGFDEIYMVGLSGGGWTTTVYSGLDSRVKRSVDVAGSFPLYISVPGRDHEQLLPGLDIGYLDFYLLAARDGRHVLIRHTDDECCFDHDQYVTEPFEDELLCLAEATGGEFRLLWVDQTAHEISSDDRDIILDEFDATTLPPGGETVIIDAGGANSSSVGSWTTFAGSYYGGVVHQAPAQPPPPPTSIYTYDFSALGAGSYSVYATWPPHANRASNARYQVFDDTTLLEELEVNQQSPPNPDRSDSGFNFEKLGDYSFATHPVVKLTNENANGYVEADAVMVE